MVFGRDRLKTGLCFRWLVSYNKCGCQLSAVHERENSMRNCFLGLGVVALVVSSFGCAKTTEDVNPVTGKITYDGKPLAGARIRLEAIEGTASRVYSCDSNDDGTFEIEAAYSTATLKGAPVGTYKVLVGKFKKEDAPDDYDPDKDDLGLEAAEAETEDGENSAEGAQVKSDINDKFNMSSTTPLKLEVKKGENTFTIELKADGTGTVK